MYNDETKKVDQTRQKTIRYTLGFVSEREVVEINETQNQYTSKESRNTKFKIDQRFKTGE